MPGKSTKTKVITFRLSNEVYAKINHALNTPRNRNSSISDYCKSVVTHWVFRHDRHERTRTKDKVPQGRLF